jgi:subtilisin family serine protease
LFYLSGFSPLKSLSICGSTAIHGNMQRNVIAITALLLTGIFAVTAGAAVEEHSAFQILDNSYVIPDATDKNRVIIQFYGEPVLSYAAGLKAEPDETNTKIKAYKDNILKTHSNAKREFEQNNIRIKINREYYGIFNGFAAEISIEDIKKLKKISYIKAVYPDQKVRALLMDSVPLINATKVWQMQNASGENITGKNVKVAIIDTGIDYTHPDLGGGFGQAHKVIAGWDFYNNDSDPMDDHGHGTHVAGIVAANGSLKGVAPDAQLMAYKVLDSNGSGPSSYVIAGIEKAVDPDGDPLTDDGADIISISLGEWGDPDDPLSQSVDNANDAGVLVVVAAGNMGPPKNTIASPGVAKNALTVGATDKLDVIVSFSSRGPVIWANSSLIKPEVVAPGVNIYSTVPSGTCALCSPSKYRILSGTSMAAPHVSGAAALLLQLHPDWTPEELKSALITTAVDLNYDVYTQGGGRIDAFKAATVEALVSPSILNLGLVNTTDEIWQAHSNFELKNIATTARNFNITVQMPYSPGIAADLSPANVSLNSNSSIVLNFSLMVNNSLTLSGYYEGEIMVQSETMTLRIPFGFIKSFGNFNEVYEDHGLDLDSNGLYESLVISVGVNVSKAGYYRVRGSLFNNSGWYIDSSINSTNLNPGKQTVQLWFNGTRIWQSRTNDTFDLKYLYLDIVSDYWTQLDYKSYAYTTKSYNYTDFRPSEPDTTPPNITDPASDHEIPDDTDNIPLWGETAQLNVTVADENNISGVTVNLSEIGGSAAKPMTNIGGNIYSATTSASSGTLPKLYNLTVNATDASGNSNTGVVVQLRVIKNGDTTGNGEVNIGDALRLANNVSYPGAYALSSIYAADVTGNGIINIGDALRLANNVSYPGNPAYILK